MNLMLRNSLSTGAAIFAALYAVGHSPMNCLKATLFAMAACAAWNIGCWLAGRLFE